MAVRLPAGWRYKKYHSSYLFAWSAAGVLAGIVLGQFVSVGTAIPLAVILSLCVVVSLRSRRWYACGIIVLAGLGFGIFRGSAFFQTVQAVDVTIGQQVVLTGKLSQDPVLENGSNLWRVQLSSVFINNQSLPSEMYATVLSDIELKRGDTVSVSGKTSDGFGTFRAAVYRAELLELRRPNDPFLLARDAFAQGVRQVVPEPEASLGLGFLVGQKSALPDDLTEQMKIVGLTHIVVASGYNLTILVRFARRLLARRSRYLALVCSLMLVIGFVLVSGFSPSMNRAAVVTLLTLVAWYYGRKFHPLQLIIYVAAGSAFVYPPYAWGDLGWLLSFTAFTGVLIVAPLTTRLVYKKDKKPGVLAQLVTETLSAEIMTLPIIIVAFGYIPVLALLANIVVAPVIPFAMFATFIAGIVGLIMPWLALLAIPASIVIAYVITVVELLSTPTWSSIAVQVPASLAWLWYGGVVVLLVMIWRRRRVDLMASSVVE